MSAARLATRRVAKVWGRTPLPEPFADPTQRQPVGEIWFEPGAGLPDLLVKYLFTADKLSVQVHPPAEASPTGRGKEECWLILDAEPGARLAMGFRSDVSRETMRSAALEGTIEDLLDWREVSPGDFFYIPAGTVHAIGAGLTLLEVQENTDITYRLHDYGRPRELHLEEALAVATGAPNPPTLHRRLAGDEETVLVDGPRFRLVQAIGEPSDGIKAHLAGAVQVIPLTGAVEVCGETIPAGQSAVADRIGDIAFAPGVRTLLATSI